MDVKSSFELVSASRDQSVRSWHFRDNGNGGKASQSHWESRLLYLGHRAQVSAVAAYPPSDKYPQGLIVSSGHDSEIKIHDPEQPSEPLVVLKGHSANVCCLHVSPLGDIISGSWDKYVSARAISSSGSAGIAPVQLQLRLDH